MSVIPGTAQFRVRVRAYECAALVLAPEADILQVKAGAILVER
jgi:hypothetical protein